MTVLSPSVSNEIADLKSLRAALVFVVLGLIGVLGWTWTLTLPGFDDVPGIAGVFVRHHFFIPTSLTALLTCLAWYATSTVHRRLTRLRDSYLSG